MGRFIEDQIISYIESFARVRATKNLLDIIYQLKGMHQPKDYLTGWDIH